MNEGFRGFPSGTGKYESLNYFPSGISIGQRIFRYDTGIDFYFNGSVWVPIESRGTSFPTSPSPVSGDPFFRTDLGWQCYYDGTRWLTAFEYSVPLGFEVSGAATTGLSATGNYAQVRPRQEFAPYITRIAAASFTLTTNDGSNYWSWELDGDNNSLGTRNVVLAWTTASDAVNTWVSHDAAPSTPSPANYFWFDLRIATKTGTPGTAFASTTVFYRLIVT